MLLTNQHPFNKQITVAVLGAPNVGKSSLINYLLGMDLSIVTHKPQTTRNKFHCVFTIDHTEIILVDTPGLHKSNKEINKRYNQQAREGSEGADVNLLLIDLTGSIARQIKEFKSTFDRELGSTWLVFTKSDLLPELKSNSLLEDIVVKAKEELPDIEKHFVISCKTEENINLLTGAMIDAAKSGPHLYPGGEVSNKNERFFVCEYIREQAFELLKEELPYEVAVVIDEYKDIPSKSRSSIISHISASILVNRASQRGIVVGVGGAMIKEIGTRSRRKIEALLGGKVHLNLHVKVSPRWFKNNYILEEMGLPRATDSSRVWRAK